MFPKINNKVSYRNNSIGDNNNLYKKYNKRIIKSEINKNKFENINLNNKIKSNNVTNNICIIIKTADNKKLDEEEKQKKSFNYDYFDSYRNIKKHSCSISQDSFGSKNTKKNIMFKNLFFFPKNENTKKLNKSFIINKNSYINNNKNKLKKSNIKYNYRIKTNSILDSNQNKISKNNNYLNTSMEKRNNNYEKDSLFTNFSDKYMETNESVLSLTSLKNRKNKYKELLQQKREFLGINFNNVDKIKIKKALYNEFKDYDKEKEEIEKRIMLNDEIIKNEEKIINYKMKKKYKKRVFSCDLYITPPYNINNKNPEKMSKKSIDTTFINDINTSKSEFSSIIDFKKIEKKDLIEKEKKFVNKNISKRNRNIINVKYTKRKNNNLFYKNSLNNFKIEKNSNRLNSNNNSLLNNKSYMDIFIPEEKMKKNVNSVVRDIMKIINKNKSKSKPKYKSPKKPRDPIFSSPRNAIKKIQNVEDGKTFCYSIKTLYKEKNEAKPQNIINNINNDKNDNHNDNDKKEFPKKLIDYILNNKRFIKSKKKEEKKIEINIPG